MTSLYEFWFDVICDGTYLWEIDRMHAKYGPIVRVNPREIHIKDSEYYNTIYTAGARKVDKDAAAVAALGIPASTTATVDHHHHHARRSYLRPYFTKRAIANMEGMIHDHIGKLCQRLQEFGENDGAVVPLDSAFSCLTADIISERLYGERLNYLAIPDFKTAIMKAFLGLDLLYNLARFFPGLVSSSKELPTAILRIVSPPMAELLALREEIKQKLLDAREGMGGNESESIIASAIGDSEIPAAERQIDRLMDEGTTIIFAGTETTARAMSVGIFYLLRDKTHLRKLRQELQCLPPRPDNDYSLSQLELLPYLTGVVHESLRLSFGPINRSPRVATHESLQYEDYTIPPGTPVSQSTYFVHTDASIFPEPYAFDPDRWTRAARDDFPLNKYLASFSKGSRQCIATQLAFTELYLTIARLVKTFEMDLHQTTMEDVAIHHARLMGYPKKTKGRVNVRGEIMVRVTAVVTE